VEQVTSFEYFILVFIASVGVLQLIATINQRKGLLFFNRKALAYLFSFLAIGGSFGWFFGWGDPMDMAMRQTGDAAMRQTGLEWAQQFLYFCMATFAALVVTLIVSSLRRARWKGHPGGSSQGLDALKERSYFEAVKNNFRSKRD
jgi:hypothetical protein